MLKRKGWLFFVCFPILLIIFLPFLLSCSWGKSLLIAAIEKKTGAEVQLQSLQLSWLGPQTLKGLQVSAKDLHASADILQLQAPLWALKQKQPKLQIQKGTFSLTAFGNDQIEDIEANIQGQQIQISGKTIHNSLIGSLSLQGTIVSEKQFEVVIDIQNFPLAILDRIYQTQPLLLQALGATANLQGSIQKDSSKGVADLTFSSPNANALCQAQFDERQLSLLKPLIASLQITEDLGDALNRFIPSAFVTGITAQQPITLRIEPENFSLPLFPFSLDALQIGSAQLDLGLLLLQNGRSLQPLLSFLNVTDLSSSKQTEIWLAPFSFQMQKGVLELGRLDFLLARSLHLCLWGTIDLPKDRLHLFLGLPAETLQRSFGISHLPDSYVLKVPIDGSLKNPQLRTQKAAAKIAALVASEQVRKRSFGLGIAIDLLKAPALSDTDIPPPKRPFPWER